MNRDSNRIRESKYLSYLLRHGAKDKNIRMSTDGFVEVDEILRIPQSVQYKLNSEIIRGIVENNDKKRFELRTLNGKVYIRACQGHSIKDLDESRMMHTITSADECPLAVHGTFKRFLPAIESEGLKVMARNHIHMTTGYPGDADVISGMRNSCEVFIEIDVKKAMDDGIIFFRSANGVVLTSGRDGVLDRKYFKNVKVRKEIK